MDTIFPEHPFPQSGTKWVSWLLRSWYWWNKQDGDQKNNGVTPHSKTCSIAVPAEMKCFFSAAVCLHRAFQQCCFKRSRAYYILTLKIKMLTAWQITKLCSDLDVVVDTGSVKNNKTLESFGVKFSEEALLSVPLPSGMFCENVKEDLLCGYSGIVECPPLGGHVAPFILLPTCNNISFLNRLLNHFGHVNCLRSLVFLKLVFQSWLMFLDYCFCTILYFFLCFKLYLPFNYCESLWVSLL